MTTRRGLIGGAVAVAVLGGGCRKAGGRPDPGLPDVVLAGAGKGLVRVDSGGVRRLGEAAALSRDGVVAYTVAEGLLARLEAASGVTVRSTALGGGWLPRVVSDDGRACVLAQDETAARNTTALLLATDDGFRKFNLSGSIEPDAFTRDNTGLFVLDWLPADAPERYRVRLLDLATGVMEPLNTRDKSAVPNGAEEEMRGEGRQAVLSADRQLLYTLYTHQPGHQHTRDLLSGHRSEVHAFVHVLHLGERWAYCLDLPHPFGEGPAAGHALAADGRHIAVFDATSGTIAYAGTVDLTIESTQRIKGGGGTASLVLTPDRRRTLVAAGRTVTVLDRDQPAVMARWKLPATTSGVRLSPDGRRLYAGSPGEVTWLDATTGTEQGSTEVPGLTDLRHIARG